MEIDDFLKNVAEGVRSTGTEAIFGETRNFDGKAVIPVARLQYGLGGGLGAKRQEEKDRESGGGGGIGVDLRPMGFLLYSDGHVTYKPIVDMTKVITVGSMIGGLFLLTVRTLLKKR